MRFLSNFAVLLATSAVVTSAPVNLAGREQQENEKRDVVDIISDQKVWIPTAAVGGTLLLVGAGWGAKYLIGKRAADKTFAQQRLALQYQVEDAPKSAVPTTGSVTEDSHPAESTEGQQEAETQNPHEESLSESEAIPAQAPASPESQAIDPLKLDEEVQKEQIAMLQQVQQLQAEEAAAAKEAADKQAQLVLEKLRDPNLPENSNILKSQYIDSLRQDFIKVFGEDASVKTVAKESLVVKVHLEMQRVKQLQARTKGSALSEALELYYSQLDMAVDQLMSNIPYVNRQALTWVQSRNDFAQDLSEYGQKAYQLMWEKSAISQLAVDPLPVVPVVPYEYVQQSMREGRITAQLDRLSQLHGAQKDHLRSGAEEATAKLKWLQDYQSNLDAEATKLLVDGHEYTAEEGELWDKLETEFTDVESHIKMVLEKGNGLAAHSIENLHELISTVPSQNPAIAELIVHTNLQQIANRIRQGAIEELSAGSQPVAVKTVTAFEWLQRFGDKLESLDLASMSAEDFEAVNKYAAGCFDWVKMSNSDLIAQFQTVSNPTADMPAFLASISYGTTADHNIVKTSENLEKDITEETEELILQAEDMLSVIKKMGAGNENKAQGVAFDYIGKDYAEAAELLKNNKPSAEILSKAKTLMGQNKLVGVTDGALRNTYYEVFTQASAKQQQMSNTLEYMGHNDRRMFWVKEELKPMWKPVGVVDPAKEIAANNRMTKFNSEFRAIDTWAPAMSPEVQVALEIYKTQLDFAANSLSAVAEAGEITGEALDSVGRIMRPLNDLTSHGFGQATQEAYWQLFKGEDMTKMIGDARTAASNVIKQIDANVAKAAGGVTMPKVDASAKQKLLEQQHKEHQLQAEEAAKAQKAQEVQAVEIPKTEATAVEDDVLEIFNNADSAAASILEAVPDIAQSIKNGMTAEEALEAARKALGDEASGNAKLLDGLAEFSDKELAEGLSRSIEAVDWAAIGRKIVRL